ncbi:hypothetical protein T4B_2500 [Trichinella pseudospiralis]|uniref:Uncharacterized protein n=1 Tax=Trichinella pseudospiralis TaxID=6337 RepID=A0A0V1JI85_TRIPS|nr:hypothetical protein T4B_2500 [Trichinella pseudospiralis]
MKCNYLKKDCIGDSWFEKELKKWRSFSACFCRQTFLNSKKYLFFIFSKAETYYVAIIHKNNQPSCDQARL